MSKYLFLFSGLILLLVSCKKETPVDLLTDDIIFDGDYSLEAFSKSHSVLSTGWSENRVVNMLEGAGTDWRRHNEFPDSGGGAGYILEDTFDIEVISSNFSFSDSFEWELDLELYLTKTEGENTRSIKHTLIQSGDFEILCPGSGVEHDFNLKLNFSEIFCQINERVYNSDNEIISSIYPDAGYEDAGSVLNSVVFETTLSEGGLILNAVDNDYSIGDYSNNTYLINEGAVMLTLKLK